MLNRSLVLGVIAATLLAAQPEINLPVIPDSAVDDPKDRDDRITIDLGRDGRIWFRGKQVDLDGLGAGLRSERRRFDLLRANAGKSGEIVFDGIKASALFVLLRADADVPWRHADWIQTILAEQKFFRLEFAVLRSTNAEDSPGKVSLHLPTPEGIQSGPGPLPNVMNIEVSVVADKERPGEWGPDGARAKASLPTALLYRFGNQESRDPKVVGKWIESICKTAKKMRPPMGAIVCNIRASSKVPCKRVLELAASFRKQGMEHVRVFGVAIPSADVRKAGHLPYPSRNELPASVGGSGGYPEVFEAPEEEVEEPR